MHTNGTKAQALVDAARHLLYLHEACVMGPRAAAAKRRLREALVAWDAENKMPQAGGRSRPGRVHDDGDV